MEINLNDAEIEFLNSEHYKLTAGEFKAITSKYGSRNQLLFAVMLQYYKIKLTFPETHNELVSYLSTAISSELKTESFYFHEFEKNDLIIKRFRQAIRKRFGFREATDADSIQFINWIISDHLHKMPQHHETTVAIRNWYQLSKIEPFSSKQEERYLDTARNKFETQLFETIVNRLSTEDKKFIDGLLSKADENNEKPRTGEISLNTLKKGIPGAKLKHVQFAIEKYEAIRSLWLPDSITEKLSRKILLKYYDRIMAYSPSHIIELDENARYAMMTIFCHIRAELLIDGLCDLFLKLVRKIKKSSENYVNKTLVKEIKRVEGKLDILSKLVETSLDHPDGVIKDTIYSVVDVETLQQLKDDLNQRGHWYKKQVRAKMRSLYSHGSRIELLNLLSLLKFNAQDDEGKALLFDAFKEANIRIGFTRFLETVGKYSNLDPDHLVMRLLLSLYAIGSNTGLKRISIANPDASETELHYVKRRFVNPTNVRLAIREVINAVIAIRDPKIFGTATTTVACDSKKLNAWDQNLMNEWHGRYKGHGIMVYWHVDTNALCIYSQSKTCTSSEVGAMIKGVLEHNTHMDLNAAYVDTHGQSTIGFGTCRLLNFKILPRLKNIHKQKLYVVSNSDKQKYKNLTSILKDTIKWKQIEEHYDEAVKHLVALKIGLVEADVFIKRFSKDNYKHPVYQALCEIGKAAKTVFLSNYLQHESLRIEINEGLNVVERLNSVMNFFFYGKLGEINSNDPDEQELSILCLHLLQACVVYINTLLIQEILADPNWRKRLTSDDYRALSPLIHSHFNPYGTFLLDLVKRLMIGIEDFNHDAKESNISQRKSEAINQVA